MPGRDRVIVDGRVSAGQQARLKDVPRLPVLDDTNRRVASAAGRTAQVNRDELLTQLMDVRKTGDALSENLNPIRNAAQQQAAFLTGKVRNRVGSGPKQDLESIQAAIHTFRGGQ